MGILSTERSCYSFETARSDVQRANETPAGGQAFPVYWTL